MVSNLITIIHKASMHMTTDIIFTSVKEGGYLIQLNLNTNSRFVVQVTSKSE